VLCINSNFIDIETTMNYKAHYDSLISRARNRQLIDVYFEKHHIVPKCMGGSDNDDNIVCLTAREHYIAHMFLVKIFNNTKYLPKLLYALRYMTVDSHDGNRSNNRDYAWMRKMFSVHHPMKCEKTRNKVSTSLINYYSNQSIEDRQRVERITITCLCGCGGMLTKKITERKKYINGHAQRHTWEDSKLKEKQSKKTSRDIAKLSKEELSIRMKNSFGSADPVKRGKAISIGKKGKKTNQQEIEIQKYGIMSNEEFENYIKDRKKNVQSRMINKRKQYNDRINDK